MRASLRALLSGVIDYAGLFPPARLSLDESIRNYARYRDQPEAWMLGRFICPAARLGELSPYVAELFDDSRPLDISALAHPARSAADFQSFRAEFAAIGEFESRHAGRARVPVLEGQLPERATFSQESDARSVFFEAPGNSPDEVESVIEFAAFGRSGFKLRTGGVEASAFPPAELIAMALVRCRQEDVPIKFTAGLHHPFRHFDASVGARMHGFLNVFIAGVLAHSAQLEQEQLVCILEDEDRESFTFDESELRWKDLPASTEQVAAVRRDHVISFGSCSFDEPRADLRSLGLL